MHELALAQQMLNVLLKTAQENEIKKIALVKILAGEMMAVVPDALEFAFRVISQDTKADGATLLIEEVKALVRCPRCSKEYAWSQHGYNCPPADLPEGS
ncbi:hypothetical protein P378_14480 [Desulforamulus profundi]|uniref:Hydrogenase maturation factor HypA n=1 Tax=Desulforamulus profundi TaxID=1383067 RepID=A0A2C6MEG4_9FIRM|nr:hydrogenase maturation nickel metallochaperone HypA [Desulforamulus profundi]PHJ37706.1 hypothetical protein P378_14480 [Desulforamulus profundi]